MTLSKSFPKKDHAIGYRGQAETVYTLVNRADTPQEMMPLLDGCLDAFRRKGAARNLQVFLEAYLTKYKDHAYGEITSAALRDVCLHVARTVRQSLEPESALAEITAELNKTQKSLLLDTMLVAVADMPSPRTVDALLTLGARTKADRHAAVLGAMRQPDNLRAMRLHGIDVEQSFVNGHAARGASASEKTNLANARRELERHRSVLDASRRDRHTEQVEKIVGRAVRSPAPASPAPAGPHRVMN